MKTRKDAKRIWLISLSFFLGGVVAGALKEQPWTETIMYAIFMGAFAAFGAATHGRLIQKASGIVANILRSGLFLAGNLMISLLAGICIKMASGHESGNLLAEAIAFSLILGSAFLFIQWLMCSNRLA